MKSDTKLTIHVIPNTHWDRAWVYPFMETRLLLVEFMDNLLHLLENDPKFSSFLLDSQTIAVEDYLTLRPEKEELIKRFVRENKLIVGPWYNLPEEYIVNGESLVRNLVVGHRYAAQYGKVSKIGYTPFSYGQTSQMPQIYKGFDIDTIIFYRGINTKKAEFIFEGPDGSQLLGCRFGALSRFSYYFYVYRMARFGMGRDEWWYDWDRGALPFRLNGENNYHEHYYPLDVSQEKLDFTVLPKQVEKLINDEKEHFTTSHIACMQGFDCSSPDPEESVLVEAANKAASELGHEMKLSTLEDFMNEMRKEVKDPEIIKGESRNPGATGKWTHLMGDIISSRTKIKRRNAQCEVILQRYAEPFSLLGSLIGGEYMKTSLDLAWKYLLQNHPHDNICGAGIDQMEKDMMYRFDQSEILSKGIMRRGLSAIVKNINNNDISIEESVITVFNPSHFSRTEVLSISIDLPEKSNYKGFSIVDSNNELVPYKLVSEEAYGTLVRNLQDISLQLRSQRIRLIAEFKDIPSFGYRTFLIKKNSEFSGKIPSEEKNSEEINHILENEFIRGDINADGSMNILDKNSAHEFKNQNYYEETGESGNPWIHMHPEEDEIITTLNTEADIELLESSRFMTKYKVVNKLTIPIGLEKIEKGHKRSAATGEMSIETEYTLRKWDKWVSVHTKIENKIEHHRVRACFPTKIDAEFSSAEAAFDVIERDIIVKESSPYYGKPNPQYPMHRFVDVSDGNIGLAIFNDGIREYEAVPDNDRTVAITLFRGFTATQSPVIDQWDVYPWMNLSQSLGINEWRYAVMPHSGKWDDANIYQEAEKFNLPLQPSQSGKGGGTLPKDFSFIKIKPDEISLSALKRNEQNSNIILRLFNPTNKDLETELEFHADVKNAWLTNMNEERKEEIRVDGNKINVSFSHKKIQTIEVEI